MLAQYNLTALFALSYGIPEEIIPDETNVPYVVGDLPTGAMPPSGSAWSEQRLLSLGYSYEQAAHKREPPPPFRAAAGS